MAKYLFKANYTAEGTKGLVAEGAVARQAQAEALVKAVGGTLVAMYFSSGETDAFVIVDAPDDAAVEAAKLVVNASGGIVGRSVPLLTAEEADAATAKARQIIASFRPPGS